MAIDINEVPAAWLDPLLEAVEFNGPVAIFWRRDGSATRYRLGKARARQLRARLRRLGARLEYQSTEYRLW